MRALTGIVLIFLALPLASTTGIARDTIYSCTDSTHVTEIGLPTPLPTPGGNVAYAVYLDDRFANEFPPIPLPYFPGSGLFEGEGTWLYLETDGLAGLQRGGHSSLPTIPLGWPAATGANDVEICNWGCDDFGGVDPIQGTGCVTHDELLFSEPELHR